MMNNKVSLKKDNIYTLNTDYHGQTYSLTCNIVRSQRKSVGFQVKAGGEIIIRSPMKVPLNKIIPIIDEHADWICKMYLKQKNKPDTVALRQAEQNNPQTAYLEKKYRAAAKRYIYERVEYYLPFTGGHYSSIRIGDPKTRWGSCSSEGTLSFSWRLMLAPPRVLDYVVIHELCHLTYMNHSAEFWAKVESIDPDYKEHRAWLKANGDSLILK